MEDQRVVKIAKKPVQERPLYEYGQVGQLLDLESRSIKRWFEGYKASRRGVKVPYPAWLNQPKAGLLSFTDLIELWFVKQFQAHGVSIPSIRSTYQTMAGNLACPHPFLRKNLWLVVGKKILSVDSTGDPESKLVMDPHSYQLYLNNIALEVGDKIEFDPDDFARRWFPLGRNRPIQVDPSIGHGEPTLIGRRLKTREVFQLWRAEGEDDLVVQEAFQISKEELKAAIEWERLISKN